MSNVNKVKLLSEHTSGVPPVIFIVDTYTIHMFCGFWIKKYFVILSMGWRPPKGIIQTYIPFKIDLYSATDCPIKTWPTFCRKSKNIVKKINVLKFRRKILYFIGPYWGIIQNNIPQKIDASDGPIKIRHTFCEKSKLFFFFF